jgi:hypothetical protein
MPTAPTSSAVSSGPSEPELASRPPLTRVLVIAAAIVAGANAAFFILSNLYFASKVTFSATGEVPAFTGPEMTIIRVSFLAFSMIVAAAAVGAARAPRAMGHGIMGLMAAASLVAGVAAAVAGMPSVLAGAELVLGAILVTIVPMSWRGSRAAWAFVVAIAAVYAIVLFFGAPKVRGVLGIGLWTTLILPGLNAVALFALISSRSRYRT